MPTDRLVHILDHDEPVRAHTAAVLRKSGYNVQTHPSGRRFLEQQPDSLPGCILLDIHIPEPNGLEVHQQLLAMGMTLPVIVFTGGNDFGLAISAMKAGALDFLEKPYRDADLLAAVHNAFERLEAKEADADRQASAAARLALLSPRETEVFHGLLAGQANKLIAHDLGLSIRTVELYRLQLMEKLSARTLSAAFRLWFDAGHEPLPQ